MMDKKLLVIIGIVAIAIVSFLAIFIILVGIPLNPGSKECVSDSDCVVYGQTGNCHCGCYNKNNQPFVIGEGQCFCAAPVSCKCQQNKCVSG